MEPSRYFTAGEFAKAAGTTKDTLIHYERIGLFVPAVRGGNHYRYYSARQLDTFDAICILRELDMPLSEIRRYLEHKSPEAFLDLLRWEEEQVKSKAARLEQTRRWLQEKARQVEACSRIRPGTVEVVSLPTQYMVCGYSRLSGNMDMALGIGKLYGKCEKYGYKSAYNVGFLQREEYVRNRIYDNYHEFYMLFDTRPEKLESRARPGGDYLCAYHKGCWEQIGETYEKLFAAADGEGLLLGQEFYEEYMLDELTVDGPEDYITRIAVKAS